MIEVPRPRCEGEWCASGKSSLGPFTVVGSSQLPRAAETAIAMGSGIDFEDHELALVGEAAMSEIDWPMPFGSPDR